MPSKSVIMLVFLLIASACGSDSPATPDPSGESEVFKVIGTMTTTRFFHTATLLKDGRVLITGGYETDRPGHSSPEFRHATAELFDPAKGTSSVTGDMSQARSQHRAIPLQDGRVIIKGNDLYPPDIYDPQSEKFAIMADAAEFGRSVATTILSTGDIFVTDEGGNAGILDQHTWEFTSSDRMIAPRTNHSATLLRDGRVLIAGGMNAAGMVKRSEIYDPTTHSFEEVGDLNDARWGHEALLLQDGRVLIIGGRRGDFNSQDVQNVTSAEFYDPAADTFAPAGDTGLSSIDSAYLLPTGKVFLLSGTEVSIFDPVTGTTTRKGHSIGQDRSLYTVTPLKDGRIMVSGGLKDLLSTDEVLVYRP